MNDSVEYIRRCDNCQKNSNLYYAPVEIFHTIMLSFPFYQLGMDILGHFPLALG